MNKPPSTPPPNATLPIIQKLIVAYKLWRTYFLRLQKIDRYNIGSRIDDLFIETIKQVFISSHKNPSQKELYLTKASDTFDLLKFMLQIAWETEVLDVKKYAALSEPLHEIGRMLGGWLRKTKTR